MRILLILAWRNIWRNKRRSLISMSSVLFAVILAITFYSMEKGSYERMIDSMVRYSTGYIQIQDVLYDEEPSMDNLLLFDDQLQSMLEGMSDRIDWVPRIQNFALAATGNITRGAMVTGIDPKAEKVMADLNADITTGEYIHQGDSQVVMAEGLAERMGLTVGDTVTLLGQGFRGTTAAGRYVIKGVARLNVPELNNRAIYMSLEAAREFYMAEERLTNLIIMPHNPSQTNSIADELKEQLDGEWYAVYTWEYLISDLLRLMKFDIGGTMVMLMILYMIIAFGLFGTILTMMVERMREMGMLLSLGMKRSQLAIVCFTETLFLSVTGAMAGVAASFPLILYLHHNPIFLGEEMATAFEDFGFEPVLPFSVAPAIFFSQALIVLGIALLISVYPVYKVYKIDIIETKKA